MDYGSRKTVVSETVCTNLKVVKWWYKNIFVKNSLKPNYFD